MLWSCFSMLKRNDQKDQIASKELNLVPLKVQGHLQKYICIFKCSLQQEKFIISAIQSKIPRHAKKQEGENSVKRNRPRNNTDDVISRQEHKNSTTNLFNMHDNLEKNNEH